MSSSSMPSPPPTPPSNSSATPPPPRAPALKLIGDLRAAGRSVATSYKTTKNIGKLLQDASASGAKHALLLAPAEWDKPGGPFVKLKNLASREEKEIPLAAVVPQINASASGS